MTKVRKKTQEEEQDSDRLGYNQCDDFIDDSEVDHQLSDF